MRLCGTIRALGLLVAVSVACRSRRPLPNPSGAAGDLAGYSVAIDGSWAIVGVPRRDSVTSDAGKALLYQRGRSGWSLQSSIAMSQPVSGAEFGWSVDIDGSRAVVGAFGDTFNNLFKNGAAYLFERSGATWTQVARVLGDTLGENGFGHSVAISGDYAVVGAPFPPPPRFTGAGAAWVYHREANGTWQRDTVLRASDEINYIEFGTAVAIDSSVIAVGALQGVTNNTVSGVISGAVYVFRRTGTTWTEEQKLLPYDPESKAHFGSSVSVSGRTIIVGARDDDEMGVDAGAAYVFARFNPGVWRQVSKLHDNPDYPGANFGKAVGVHGGRAVVGAWLSHTPASVRSGEGFQFTEYQPAWEHRQTTSHASPEDGDGFGFSVGVSQDCAIAGAPNRRVGDLEYVGAGYIFCGLPDRRPQEFNLDIICCLQPPDFIGPVVFTTRIVNLTTSRLIGSRSVDAVNASGAVEEVSARSTLVIAPGDSVIERHILPATTNAPAGGPRWRELRVHWHDASGRHTSHLLPQQQR
ncbi:MAG: hypothetical protein ACT4P7_05070 [Gemmatimonadaceae bacterium]